MLRTCQVILILLLLWLGTPPATGDWLIGLSYYQQGKYRHAVDELLTEVRENPEDPLVNRILGLSYYHLQDYDQAENYLRKAKDLQADFQAELGLVQVHVRRRDYEAALQALEDSQGLIRTDQQRFQYHFARGSILLGQGQLTQARRDFKKAESLGGHQPALYAQLGLLEYNLGNVTESITALERSLELDRAQPAVLVSLGEACLRLSTNSPAVQKSYLGRAADLAREALTLIPDSVEAHSLAGRAYLGLRDFANAEKQFRRVLALNSGHPGIYYSLGQALIGLDRYQEGIEVLERAVENNPQDATIFYALGFCQEKIGHHRKALDSYRQAQQLRPAPQYAAAAERVQKQLESTE